MRKYFIGLALLVALTLGGPSAFAKDYIHGCVTTGTCVAQQLATTIPTVAASGASAVTSASGAVKAVSGDAASVINNAVDKGSEAIGMVAAKLQDAAPGAWKLVVEGVKAKAEAGLTVGLLCLLWSLVSWVAFYRSCKKAWLDGCDLTKYCFIGIGTAASAILGSFFAAHSLLDPNTWAALYSPDGFLANQILQQALQHI